MVGVGKYWEYTKDVRKDLTHGERGGNSLATGIILRMKEELNLE